MYLKLIFYILLLTIFTTISNGKLCKFDRKKGKILRNHRAKRGVSFSCIPGGAGRKIVKSIRPHVDFEKDEIKEEIEVEFFNEEMLGGFYNLDHYHSRMKRVLYICDNFNYSAVQFDLEIANLLSTKYIVDMFVYTTLTGFKIATENFNLIHVEIDTSHLDTSNFYEELFNFRKSNEYIHLGIYKDFMENRNVRIGQRQIGILDYLQRYDYSFGMADFEVMAGSFEVFHALGIKTTFNARYNVFFPKYLHLLGIDVTDYIIPDFQTAMPGDWNKETGICNKNSVRYSQNIEKHNEISNSFIKELEDSYKEYYPDLFKDEHRNRGLNGPMPLNELFKNISHHFVNQNEFGIFEDFPKLEDEIMYIGGIDVEEKGILTENKVERDEPQCVVVVALASRIIGNVQGMIDEFSPHAEKCVFKARMIDVRLRIALLPPNIIFTGELVEYQNILRKTNTKLFISHCDLNSLNEAMYAGVPLICIPYAADEFYNASLVEHLGIGIYVHLGEGFAEALRGALKSILVDNFR